MVLRRSTEKNGISRRMTEDPSEAEIVQAMRDFRPVEISQRDQIDDTGGGQQAE
jgi:hypothetical protein